MNKPEVIIIHGAYGEPNANWFPWLADELEKRGHKAMVPCFPTPEGQELSNWLRAFQEQIGELGPKHVLVGHSLAPAFMLTLLENALQPVLATFMVSAFIGFLGLEEFDPINRTFVTRDFDWEVIRRNAGYVKLYHSDNDPYVPLSKGEDLAQLLAAELVVLKNAGHINKGSGYTSFPMLLDDIDRFLRNL